MKRNKFKILFFFILSYIVFIPIYGHIQDDYPVFNIYEKIVQKKYLAPYQYRYISHLITYNLSGLFLFFWRGIAIHMGVFLINVFFCFLSIIVFDLFLKKYYNRKERITISILFFLFIIFMRTAPEPIIPPNNLINLFLTILGIYFIRENKFNYLIATVFFGGLIRETISILILIYFLDKKILEKQPCLQHHFLFRMQECTSISAHAHTTSD